MLFNQKSLQCRPPSRNLPRCNLCLSICKLTAYLPFSFEADMYKIPAAIGWIRSSIQLCFFSKIYKLSIDRDVSLDSQAFASLYHIIIAPCIFYLLIPLRFFVDVNSFLEYSNNFYKNEDAALLINCNR